MKTNFTIGKQLVMAFALIAVTLTSCKKDEETPATDISGKYSLTSATLIDGDLSNTSTTDLVIQNALYDQNSQSYVTATLPAGESTYTMAFVNAVLSNASPCESTTVAWTYKIDLQKGGTLEFICTSEGDTSTSGLGIWTLSSDEKTLSLSITSSTLGKVDISITDLVITDTSITGTISGFPMVKDAAQPIGLSNLQYISFDVTISI